jgi:hypothetical protein
MTWFKGALGGLAGDLSLTILSSSICSVCGGSFPEMPKTNGIGRLVSGDLMALPKSNVAGELREKSEEESPSWLMFLSVELGEIEYLCGEGSFD